MSDRPDSGGSVDESGVDMLSPVKMSGVHNQVTSGGSSLEDSWYVE